MSRSRLVSKSANSGEGYVDVIDSSYLDRDKSRRFDLASTICTSTDSSFQVLRVSRDVRLAGFPHFLPNLRGQGACERKGDCNKKSGSDQSKSRGNEREKTNRERRGRRER